MFEATEEEMFKGTSEEFPAIFGVTTACCETLSRDLTNLFHHQTSLLIYSTIEPATRNKHDNTRAHRTNHTCTQKHSNAQKYKHIEKQMRGFSLTVTPSDASLA